MSAQQEPGAKKVLDRFASLLSEAMDDKVTVERVPSSTPVPLGGLNAQTAIIVASCIGDRSNAVNLLDRLLRRTAQGDGKFGVPPTHLVVISTLGTERTDKFPYNGQNLFGGKLSKRRDVEEAIIGTVKGRMPGVQMPLDYTIVKLGDIAEDAKAGGELSLIPGDVLDGQVGVEAAANVLLQATAFQPSARNSTLCVTGGMEAELSDEAWDDTFLRLDGPELLRLDGLASAVGVKSGDETDLDRRYDRLSEYLKEWSQQYEDGAKGTGLTTPVDVQPSKKYPSLAQGTIATSGVRLLFRQTNTGQAYKSKDEERAFERERSTPKKPASGGQVIPPPKRKATKEGGVEVLAELTVGGDLRVRARRCNMDDNVVVKEISEKTITKALEKGINVWIKEQNE